ncbi:MAG: IS3 family transposase [Bacteroidales bacterium]|nr:IS3 family transposase [Bacteroidales bacterium]
MEKRKMIEPETKISLSRQCDLIELSRSSFYYNPRPASDKDLGTMKRLDEVFTDNPDFGSRQLRNVLNALKREGYKINRKRVQRLMRIMGIQALYPGKNLSKPGIGSEHKIYPYLLRNMKIDRPNQVWSTDITYIRLKHGFIYLVGIIDWYSKKLLSWELSTTMDQEFCLSTYRRAVNLYGAPEILNSDQGSQFTSKDYREMIRKSGAKFSMDGKGRALDNIAIERFWRTLKYGEVYLKEYQSVNEAKIGINTYIKKYNSFRPHTAHGIQTPDEVYQMAA